MGKKHGVPVFDVGWIDASEVGTREQRVEAVNGLMVALLEGVAKNENKDHFVEAAIMLEPGTTVHVWAGRDEGTGRFVVNGPVERP